MRFASFLAASAASLFLAPEHGVAQDLSELERQVLAAEGAFAQSMAARVVFDEGSR